MVAGDEAGDLEVIDGLVALALPHQSRRAIRRRQHREIEAAQTIIGCRESQPGFCVTRMLFDRQAEVLFSKAEIVGAILLLAKAQFVIRIAAEEAGRGGRRRTSAL